MGQLKPFFEPFDSDVRHQRGERRIENLERRAQLPDSGGGIDFNKTNLKDVDGNDAEYLAIEINGGSTSTYTNGDALGPLAFFLSESGQGSFAWINNGGGYILLQNNGDGLPISAFAGAFDYGGSSFTGAAATENVTAAGLDLVGIAAINNGAGNVIIGSTGSITVIDNNHGGIIITSTGSDANNVSIKVMFDGADFLVCSDQNITRDPTTHALTGLTYNNERLRINSTDFVITGLPTSNPGGSGKLWNSSGTLKIT